MPDRTGAGDEIGFMILEKTKRCGQHAGLSGTRAQVSRMPAFMWLDPAAVARDGYAAVTRGDAVYVNGRIYRAMILGARLLPQALVMAVMRGNAKKFRKL